MGMRIPQALTLKAHAKVNLCLAVSYPPHDGYHQLSSVFQELDLHDLVRVSSVKLEDSASLVTSMGTHVDLRCEVEGLDPRDNLMFRALDQVEQTFDCPIIECDQGLLVEVDKRIPAGGGLGGGSSDAACMLKAYAQLAGVELLDPGMLEVARGLGADVAFFLHGGCALMGGRGDVLERALPPLQAPIVLMGSDDGLSTARVYQAFDDTPVPEPDAGALADALAGGSDDIARIAKLCANNLGPAACAADPRILERIEFAQSHDGVLAALVSGSGATSFAICVDEPSARQLARDIASICGWVHVCSVPRFIA